MIQEVNYTYHVATISVAKAKNLVIYILVNQEGLTL